MNADMTVEIPENLAHLRRQDVNRRARPILRHHANSPRCSEQPAPAVSLDKNEPILLVLEYAAVPDVKIHRELLAEFTPSESLGLNRLFYSKVSDNVERRITAKFPALQTRIQHEQVSFSEFS